MDYNIHSFEKLLMNAMKKCEGMYVEEFTRNFQLIYPFTTENISGYINEFKLKGKTLMTVGSSGDQIINGALYGCKSITSLDINPYTKFYTYLKIACLLEVERNEFLEFLRLIDFPKVFKNNKEPFKVETYNKIKKTLRLLDYESYLIWDELLQTFSPIDIRKNLFSCDENSTDVIIKSNPYLKSEEAYYETREKIKKIELNFITGDLLKASIDKQFDNIWLSNIGTYLSRHFVKFMVDKITDYLNNNRKLLISYLYQTTINTKYQEEWSLIYDIEKTFAILRDYSPYLVSFIGVEGLELHDSKIKDSILVYRK